MFTKGRGPSVAQAAFITGYIAALRDIERTGLRPMTEQTMERSAQRAWHAQTIEGRGLNAH